MAIEKKHAASDRQMAARLKQQLVVHKEAQKRKSAVAKADAATGTSAHRLQRRLDEIAFYPAHDARKESSEYVRAHKHLVNELDLPCLVCGVKKSTLTDPDENPYGARALETHHHVIEWALANAIDTDKFNKIMLPHLRHRHPTNPFYNKAALTPAEVAAWVDHSEDNLWVLCDVHHRAKFFGIHSITFPTWGPQDLLRPDFESYVRGELKKAGAGAKRGAAAGSDDDGSHGARTSSPRIKSARRRTAANVARRR